MKHFLLLTFIGFLLGLTACKDDEQKGSLTLHFIPLYDEQTLQTFTNHPFAIGQQIRFTHMSMLVSDIRLFDQSSEEILDDVELVDVSFNELLPAEEGYTMTLGDIPAGTYDGIRFGVGVPPDVNAKKPADFPSTSPLSKTGYYWVAWNSYIFMKTEGVLDSLGNGTFDLGYAMHTGSDDLFRSLEGTLPLVIEDGKETVLTIAIDYKKLLEGVDIKSSPQNHTPQDTAEILKIVNNLGSALSLLQ